MQTTSENTVSSTVHVTDRARRKVYELMEEEGNLELKLRVFVTGGGCSGFSYGFSFDEIVNEDDFVFIKAVPERAEGAAIKLLVDAISMPYLAGASIDYRKDVQGERFIITGNPQAKTTCGCGSSFSAE